MSTKQSRWSLPIVPLSSFMEGLKIAGLQNIHISAARVWLIAFNNNMEEIRWVLQDRTSYQKIEGFPPIYKERYFIMPTHFFLFTGICNTAVTKGKVVRKIRNTIIPLAIEAAEDFFAKKSKKKEGKQND